MRIALTADPELPVPPRLYGGIERVVDMLARGLAARGHHVTLIAHPDSTAPCALRPYPARHSRGRANLLRNTRHVTAELLRGGYDLVHSFGRLAYLLPLLPLRLPKLMSYQRHITPRSVRLAGALAGGSLHFSGCSGWLIRAYAGRPNWHMVHNGAPAAAYTPRAAVPDDAPLLFLGRLEAIKGPHLAIAAARQSGRALVLAGNLPDDAESRAFFARAIAPHLDGDRIRYVGAVTDAQKDVLLGAAAALLMPVLWDEPFGIVMAEALACGTPVVGLRRGAVPEVVEDGVSGYVVGAPEELPGAIARLGAISRRACRRAFEERFSDAAVVAGYERVYRAMTGGRG